MIVKFVVFDENYNLLNCLCLDLNFFLKDIGKKIVILFIQLYKFMIFNKLILLLDLDLKQHIFC